jgi:prepilin-type N-terminal cleavage/methylation domain-containing protein
MRMAETQSNGNGAGRRAGGAGGRGFTLIEIMVVIAIIIILAAISVAVGVGVKQRAGVKSTRAQLLAMDGLMETYLKNAPEFPTSGLDTAASPPYPASDTTLFVRALQTTPDAKQIEKFLSSDRQKVLDAFGTEVHYVPPGLTQDRKGYFWSAGPDRVLNTGDDIRSNQAG